MARERVVRVFVRGWPLSDLGAPVDVDCDGHTIRVRFRKVAGRLEVYSLEVVRVPWEGRSTTRPITASNLRLPWAEIIAKARESHYFDVASVARRPLDEEDAQRMLPARREAMERGFKLDPYPPASAPEAARIKDARDQLPAIIDSFQDRTSHRGRPPKYDLALVATLYREGLDASNSPTRYVAEGLGVSRSTAAKQVARARAEGELEAAPKQGVAGLVRSRKRGKKR
jgi:hypothetical protein